MTGVSRYYETNAADPSAPVVLDLFGGIRPGDRVEYVGPVPLSNGVLVVEELLAWEGGVPAAVLSEDGRLGVFEVDAVNLRRVER